MRKKTDAIVRNDKKIATIEKSPYAICEKQKLDPVCATAQFD